MGATAKKLWQVEEVACGVFSKQDASHLVEKGISHIHSTSLGERDPLYQLTCRAAAENSPLHYPWEGTARCHFAAIDASASRHNKILEMLSTLGLNPAQRFGHRVQGILEELITNGMFHAYKNKDGSAKYSRREKTQLDGGEPLRVGFENVQQGIFLSVEDCGGTLKLQDIGKALHRCYAGGETQIETKDQGAGLGMYMIFDSATHIKIEVTPNKRTFICCWVGGKGKGSETSFSFNFFQKG